MSDYRLIPLSGKHGSGHFAEVDAADFDSLNLFRWHMLVAKSGLRYAARSSTKAEQEAGQPRIILMHRQIMGAAPGVEIDHDNGNGLCNSRQNLKTCSHAENMQNRKIYKNNTSGHPGVIWDKKKGRWRVCIKHEGVFRRFGSHKTFEEAVKARVAAEQLLGRQPHRKA